MSTYVFEDVVRVPLAVLDVVNENVVNCFLARCVYKPRCLDPFLNFDKHYKKIFESHKMKMDLRLKHTCFCADLIDGVEITAEIFLI